MPRKARVLVPNCPHHVLQRGHNRKAVFVSDEDYQYYLENLREWKEALDIKLYGWCLMTNHIHLIVEPGEEVMNLPLLMKRINGRQSEYVNKLEGRSGALWEGRYKASPIQRDAYLLSCLRYVELNPVKAGMVNEAKEYPWLSYLERMCQLDNRILDRDSCYLSLGAEESQRMIHYNDFIHCGISESEQRFLREVYQRNQLTGNSTFTHEIEGRIGLRVEQCGRGRPTKEEK